MKKFRILLVSALLGFSVPMFAQVEPTPQPLPSEDVTTNYLTDLTVNQIFYAPGWTESPDYTLDITPTKLTFETKKATFERWQAQFKFNVGPFTLSKDKTYKLSFTVTSNVDTNAPFLVKLFETDDIYFVSEEFDLMADAPTEISYVLKPVNKEDVPTDMNIKIFMFDFGANDPFVVTVENYKLEEVSTPSAVEEVAANEGVIITPNPVQDVLFLQSVDEMASLAIYDLSGQVVLSAALEGTEAQVEVAGLNAGVYVVQVITANQKKVSTRILKK